MGVILLAHLQAEVVVQVDVSGDNLPGLLDEVAIDFSPYRQPWMRQLKVSPRRTSRSKVHASSNDEAIPRRTPLQGHRV